MVIKKPKQKKSLRLTKEEKMEEKQKQMLRKEKREQALARAKKEKRDRKTTTKVYFERKRKMKELCKFFWTILASTFVLVCGIIIFWLLLRVKNLPAPASIEDRCDPESLALDVPAAYVEKIDHSKTVFWDEDGKQSSAAMTWRFYCIPDPMNMNQRRGLVKAAYPEPAMNEEIMRNMVGTVSSFDRTTNNTLCIAKYEGTIKRKCDDTHCLEHFSFCGKITDQFRLRHPQEFQEAYIKNQPTSCEVKKTGYFSEEDAGNKQNPSQSLPLEAFILDSNN